MHHRLAYVPVWVFPAEPWPRKTCLDWGMFRGMFRACLVALGSGRKGRCAGMYLGMHRGMYQGYVSEGSNMRTFMNS